MSSVDEVGEEARLRNLEEINLLGSLNPTLRAKFVVVKKRWLREFLIELHRANVRAPFRLIDPSNGQPGLDDDEDTAIFQTDLEQVLAMLPLSSAGRLRRMIHVTANVTTTLATAIDADNAATESQVENTFQRLADHDQNVYRVRREDSLKEHQQVDAGHLFIAEQFHRRVTASVVIQRAFREFRARCLVTGWPSKSIKRQLKSQARYLRDVVKEAQKQAQLTPSHEITVFAARHAELEQVKKALEHFEKESEMRAHEGILRAPKAGPSPAYQLHNRSYRVLLLGKSFVDREDQAVVMEQLRKEREEQEALEREEIEAKNMTNKKDPKEKIRAAMRGMTGAAAIKAGGGKRASGGGAELLRNLLFGEGLELLESVTTAKEASKAIQEQVHKMAVEYKVTDDPQSGEISLGHGSIEKGHRASSSSRICSRSGSIQAWEGMLPLPQEVEEELGELEEELEEGLEGEEGGLGLEGSVLSQSSSKQSSCVSPRQTRTYLGFGSSAVRLTSVPTKDRQRTQSMAGGSIADGGEDMEGEQDDTSSRQHEERLMALYSAGLMRTSSRVFRPGSGSNQAAGYVRSTTRRVSISGLGPERAQSSRRRAKRYGSRAVSFAGGPSLEEDLDAEEETSDLCSPDSPSLHMKSRFAKDASVLHSTVPPSVLEEASVPGPPPAGVSGNTKGVDEELQQQELIMQAELGSSDGVNEISSLADLDNSQQTTGGAGRNDLALSVMKQGMNINDSRLATADPEDDDNTSLLSTALHKGTAFVPLNQLLASARNQPKWGSSAMQPHKMRQAFQSGSSRKPIILQTALKHGETTAKLNQQVQQPHTPTPSQHYAVRPGRQTDGWTKEHHELLDSNSTSTPASLRPQDFGTAVPAPLLVPAVPAPLLVPPHSLSPHRSQSPERGKAALSGSLKEDTNRHFTDYVVHQHQHAALSGSLKENTNRHFTDYVVHQHQQLQQRPDAAVHFPYPDTSRLHNGATSQATTKSWEASSGPHQRPATPPVAALKTIYVAQRPSSQSIGQSSMTALPGPRAVVMGFRASRPATSQGSAEDGGPPQNHEYQQQQQQQRYQDVHGLSLSLMKAAAGSTDMAVRPPTFLATSDNDVIMRPSIPTMSITVTRQNQHVTQVISSSEINSTNVSSVECSQQRDDMGPALVMPAGRHVRHIRTAGTQGHPSSSAIACTTSQKDFIVGSPGSTTAVHQERLEITSPPAGRHSPQRGSGGSAPYNSSIMQYPAHSSHHPHLTASDMKVPLARTVMAPFVKPFTAFGRARMQSSATSAFTAAAFTYTQKAQLLRQPQTSDATTFSAKHQGHHGAKPDDQCKIADMLAASRVATTNDDHVHQHHKHYKQGNFLRRSADEALRLSTTQQSSNNRPASFYPYQPNTKPTTSLHTTLPPAAAVFDNCSTVPHLQSTTSLHTTLPPAAAVFDNCSTVPHLQSTTSLHTTLPPAAAVFDNCSTVPHLQSTTSLHTTLPPVAAVFDNCSTVPHLQSTASADLSVELDKLKVHPVPPPLELDSTRSGSRDDHHYNQSWIRSSVNTPPLLAARRELQAVQAGGSTRRVPRSPRHSLPARLPSASADQSEMFLQAL
ncbi:hypothetical protein CEUSTIGMA_g4414.t1 [Chlamydomonas eustigma]|uniref:Uncharacterized protein n=1 Tax=Chlamydomonas eustigma TaxID=1157962 RepID=A0A250X1K7_9CHLO|nr:hypothetical protein CEUSTIGMA_g4414.t1 [Chlamydomonas eustigma]|eukprot:GAX76967.1 hypothetical protein CEUSTIGMA_g4414.t1 [Chlamydomonas eustigma]